MSLRVENSPKHCARRGFHIEALLKKRRFVYGFLTILSLMLFLVFIAWLVLHPSKPEFYLKDASVYELTLSPQRQLVINSSIQATLLSRNPNARVGVYYDALRAYAVYRDQQITAESPLPPFYQGHEDANLLSASLRGTGVPVAPSVGYGVGRDVQVAGRMLLLLKLDGQLRWKVGSWVSGRYRFDVRCDAVVGVPPAAGGAGDPSSMSSGVLLGSVQGSQCSTSV
ncbi:NDR1/HIN1-like protein 1 [Iris pallida]|uniref:NDR1/HIN1-like protein 1 n=1 Tax=Iris pallida TaxID=29817 RepID=A0AAX6GZ56_IRIPA|nr:NDR1/HIN1-like protein 1 [Iris pallida]KAJ6833833.1 NDR1/HIN1-like protein 1 [Iris pallida]